MEYTCSTCGENVGKELVTFIDHTEGHIIDVIKAKHPEWQQADGLCKKCEDYFRQQMEGNKGN